MSTRKKYHAPLSSVLQQLFSRHQHIFEIGSGNGQLSKYLASQLPHLLWQTSECIDQLPFLEEALASDFTFNLLPPIHFELGIHSLPIEFCDGIFTSHTFHYWGPDLAKIYFEQLVKSLKPEGTLVIFGPFKRASKFLCKENEVFDRNLRFHFKKAQLLDVEHFIYWTQQLRIGPLKMYVLDPGRLVLAWSLKEDGSVQMTGDSVSGVNQSHMTISLPEITPLAKIIG